MKQKLNIREIQLEEKEILKKTIKFLDDNNLSYQIAYGTLLGAVRHNGFIPWDDDIDIIMPRTHYDKLQQLMKKSNGKLDNELYFHSIELKNLNLPFTKVYNYNFMAIDKFNNDKYEKYLWIDIFPIDGVSINQQVNVKLLNKRKILATIIGLKRTPFKFITNKHNSILKNFSKICLKIIFSILPPNFCAKRISKIAKRFDYNNCEVCANFSWSDKLNEIFPKHYYEYSIEFDFEGMKVKGPKEYDKILNQIYGNYMELPPVEQRLTHGLEVWKK